VKALKVLVGIFALIGCLAIAGGGYYVYTKLKSGGFGISSPIKIARPGEETTATATAATPRVGANAESSSILADYQKDAATPTPPAGAAPISPGAQSAPGVTPPAMSAAAQLAARPIRTPDPSVKVIKEWPSGRKWVALTFDDGPHPEWTPKFIDLLKSKNVKATFFLIGPNVQKHQDIARLLAEGGFELANHTMTHPQFRSASKEKISEELGRTNEIIKEVTGIPAVTLMRPPYGQYPQKVQDVCDELGLKIVTWNIDTDDWRATTKEDEMTSNVMKNLKDGAIILMHDRSEKAYNTTARIIDDIRAKGYEFVTVSELLGWKQHTPWGGAAPAAGAPAGATPAAATPAASGGAAAPAPAASATEQAPAVTAPAPTSATTEELPRPQSHSVTTTPPPRR